MGIEPKTAFQPPTRITVEIECVREGTERHGYGDLYCVYVRDNGELPIRYTKHVYQSIEEISAFMMGLYDEAGQSRRSFNYSGPTLIAADRIRALIRTKKQKC